MRAILALSLFMLLTAFATLAPSTPANAQATCRAACTSDENACLQRTNNKSQCGGKAQSCIAKCR